MDHTPAPAKLRLPAGFSEDDLTREIEEVAQNLMVDVRISGS